MAAVKLQAGWLQKDLEKAIVREQYWARPPVNTPSQPKQAASDSAPPKSKPGVK